MPAYYQSGTTTDTQTMLGIMQTFMTGSLGYTHLFTNPLESISDSPSDANKRFTMYFSKNGGYYFLTTGIEGATVDYRTWIGGGCLAQAPATTPVYDTADPYSLNHDGNEIWAYDDQDGYVYTASSNNCEGPYTKYHLFGGQEGLDGWYCYLVLETTAGLFTHFGIGALDRIGSLTSRFAVGTVWNATYERSAGASYHQRMFDGISSYNSGGRGHIETFQIPNDPEDGEQYVLGYNSSHCYGSAIGGLNAVLSEDSPNEFNGRAMLMPIHVRLQDNGSPTNWLRIVGMAPAMRFVRIDNLQPEDVVDTDWMIFPIRAKNAVSGPTSGYYGWAYRWQ